MGLLGSTCHMMLVRDSQNAAQVPQALERAIKVSASWLHIYITHTSSHSEGHCSVGHGAWGPTTSVRALVEIEPQTQHYGKK